MTLEEARKQFPHTGDEADAKRYVNHAATAPLSRPVRRAMGAFLDERAGGNVNNYESFAPVIERTRERAARLLGAGSAERVAFASNTSAALSILAEGLDWQEGDRLAVPSCEFPANVYPFLNLERRGVAVDFIPTEEGAFTVDDVAQTLRPETRLLTVSWVQFLSGFRADLETLGQLCAERGVVFCVDAIQGLGALEMDVQRCGIDFLACGGHKWLMGPQGTGLLYVSEALQETIRPPAGWTHGPVDWEHLSEYRLRFHPEARRYETGTANRLGLAGLGAALELLLDGGAAEVEAATLARAGELADRLEAQGLARYGSTGDAAPASGIVTVRHPQPEALFEHLADAGVEAAMRNGLVRFSPAFYHKTEDVERVAEAVAAFA
ncbi:MAG: aminotransferase [Bacteroidetes bacterium QS_8_68_15]|nr:MAG: aminotransferase [Bacteroidetes bacterium QS_8_68_15]